MTEQELWLQEHKLTYFRPTHLQYSQTGFHSIELSADWRLPSLKYQPSTERSLC